MSFELKYGVIHSFTKDKKSSVIKEVVLKKVVLDNALPAVVSLVKGVTGLLGKPGSSVSYGQFGDDMRQGTFPSAVEKYTSSEVTAETFLDLSYIAVGELSNSAKDEPLATGGHILVASYLLDGVPYFLVAMIKQHGGVSLDKNYVPIEITEIDLTKVNQAARINISRYLEVLGEEVKDSDDEEIDQTYLCFVGQQSGSIASGYFVKALGCTKGISSSRATSNTINGIESFLRKAELKKYKARARDSVIYYLKVCIEAGRSASLEEICHAATSNIPPQDIEFASNLKEYLNGDKCKVPAQFAVHHTTLKKRIRIREDGPQWSVQFERQILGVTPDSIVCYNKEEKSLTFRNLTDRLIKSIESGLDPV